MKWIIVLLILLALITMGALTKANRIRWADSRRWVVMLWQRIDWKRITEFTGEIRQWLREMGSSIRRRLMLFVGFLQRQWPRIIGVFLGAIALLVALVQFLKKMPPRVRGKTEGPLVYFTFPLVRFLARRNMFFTAIEEGTAKIVLRGAETSVDEETGKKVVKRGAFKKALIQWEGFTLSRRDGADAAGNPFAKWDVVRDGTMVDGEVQREPHHPFGGIRFYGWWPLDKIHTYKFRWAGVDVGGNIQLHPSEVIDYVLLREDVYWCELLEVEDHDLLHIDVELLLRIRVINPQKALYRIQNWLETVLNRTKPLVRGYIAQPGNEYEHLIAKRTGAGQEVWNALEGTHRIQEFRNDYGVEIPAGGIEFKSIEPPEGYRERTLIRWQAEQERRGVEVTAQAQRRRIGILGLRGLVGRILDKMGG